MTADEYETLETYRLPYIHNKPIEKTCNEILSRSLPSHKKDLSFER